MGVNVVSAFLSFVGAGGGNDCIAFEFAWVGIGWERIGLLDGRRLDD